MRMDLAVVLVVAAFTACSGAGSTVCEPYDATPCMTETGADGSKTCLSDGSGYGECEVTDSCTIGTANGCCMNGASQCCPCIQNDCGNAETYASMHAFIECVCMVGACAAECETECLGGGISLDQACESCANTAAQTTCKAQHDACR